MKPLARFCLLSCILGSVVAAQTQESRIEIQLVRPDGSRPGMVAQTPPIDPNAPKATLRGHVYAQDTGTPVKRAIVTLSGDRRPGEPMTVSTDAQGAFEFKNVDAGNYRLSVNRTGFIPAMYGQKAPNQPSVPLTVRPGEELKSLDFHLVRGGVITGVVMDEDGEPLSNVQVQVMSRQYMRGQSRLFARNTATTDDRGQYRIFNLSPGRYYVQATLRAYGDQESGYAPIFYPNALTVQDAQRIEVTKGAEVTRIDLRLRPVPTYSVSGKVFDQQTGQPVGDGGVSAMPADFTGGGYQFSQLRPDGSFRIRGLLPGRYRLIVMTNMRGPGQPQRPAAKPFDLGAANLENLVVTIGPGVSVRGKVIAEGGTLTPDNLRVSLSPKEFTGGPVFGGGSVTVGKDLTFELQNVQPGEYFVNVFGFSSPASVAAVGGQSGVFYVREVRAGGENVVDRGLAVSEAAAVPDLEVVLDFAPGSVSGRVVNDAGEPISGVQVALVAADREKRSQDRYFRSTAADQNGQFTVRSVIPGDYLLVVWPETDVGRILDPDLFAQLEKHAVSVTVEKSSTANKDLKLTSEIRTIAQSFAQ